MITGTEIYWFTRLDALHTLAGVAIGVSLVVIAFAIPAWVLWSQDGVDCFELRVAKRATIWCSVVTLLFGSILMFVPTSKEYAAIYLIPKIANNEQVQKVPDNFVKLLNTRLEQWIKDTVKDNSK